MEGIRRESIRPLVTVSVLCHNALETTRRCIDHLIKHHSPDITYILTNNGSTDETLDYLLACALPNTIVVDHPENMGFGPAHNYALELCDTLFFAALNNDLYIKEPDWAKKLIDVAADPKIAIVGIDGTPSTLSDIGDGFLGDVVDYVDGGLLVGRTELFRKYGLFSPALAPYSFEDSDLSLRFRQLGYDIAHVPLAHQHERWVTRKTLDMGYRKQVAAKNRAIFLARWSVYLKTHNFQRRILVKIPSWGIGDNIALTPVVAAIKRDHPGSSVEVDTMWPDVFWKNPAVSFAGVCSKEPESQFDRVITLSPNYAGEQPIYHEAAKIAATTVADGRPQLFVTYKERREAENTLGYFVKSKRPVVVCHFAIHHRDQWLGRSWNQHQAKSFVNALRQQFGNAIGIVEVGRDIPSTGRAHIDLIGKTDLRQLFAIVERADLVVAIDSAVSHIARAFNKPLITLWGATAHTSRTLKSPQETWVYGNTECRGCYQKRGNPDVNSICDAGERCMDIPHSVVLESVRLQGVI